MHDFGKIVAPTMCELFVRRLADMILSGSCGSVSICRRSGSWQSRWA